MAEYIEESSAPPESVFIDDVLATDVAPGIVRRPLPSSGQVLVRAFDMAPSIEWPEVDSHDRDELIYIVSGVLLDHGQSYPAGTYLWYRAGSSHRPRTDVGVRILVIGSAVAEASAK